MISKCDICGKELTKNDNAARVVMQFEKSSSSYTMCEGCFMSFEYWKDVRQSRIR